MTYLTIVLQIIVGLAFIALAIAKFLGLPPIRDAFQRLRLPMWTRWPIGLVQLIGGAAMLASVALPFLAFFAAVLLTLVLVGALLAHFVRGPRAGWQVAAGLLIAVLAVAGLQPLGLRVLALPKTDELPVERIASHATAKTYSAGFWFEGVAVGPDGTLYLAANEGLNVQTGDKTNVRATILARAPSGGERVFFKFPAGSTAGAIAFGKDNTMYVTGDGASRGVWRFVAGSEPQLFAKLPEGSWPNGIDVGPDSKIYVADSLLGKIWKIDPSTGAAETAIEHPALLRRAFVALAPGANGVRFFGRDLFVTVSDSGEVLKFPLTTDGALGAPETVATGVPGDDLAIDPNGVLYVTTHPYNTVVRITPDGTRSIVADAESGAIGSTAIALGRTAADRNTLYMVTDGGAFAGNAEAKGRLVALQLPAR